MRTIIKEIQRRTVRALYSVELRPITRPLNAIHEYTIVAEEWSL